MSGNKTIFKYRKILKIIVLLWLQIHIMSKLVCSDWDKYCKNRSFCVWLYVWQYGPRIPISMTDIVACVLYSFGYQGFWRYKKGIAPTHSENTLISAQTPDTWSFDLFGIIKGIRDSWIWAIGKKWLWVVDEVYVASIEIGLGYQSWDFFIFRCVASTPMIFFMTWFPAFWD